MKTVSYTKNPIFYLAFFLAVITTTTTTTTKSTLTASACQVWNTEGVDVSEDYVVEKDSLADCQGDSQCKDFNISNCDQVICWGIEACTRVHITNVTSLVSCEGYHSCHRTEVLGLKTNGLKKKDEVVVAYTPKVQCIGTAACDVAILENLSDVECLGFKACRKATIKSDTVKCTGGDATYTACDQAYLHTKCIYCGVHGCAKHKCNVKVVGTKDDVMAIDAEEDDPTSFEQCELETIMGEDASCPNEWAAELQYEMEVEYGTEENEDGTRR